MDRYRKNLLVLVAAFFVVATFAYAKTETDPCNGGLCNPLGATNDLGTLILKIVDGVAYVGYYIVVLAILYAGFKYIEARGKDKKLTEAKDNSQAVFIGAVLLLGATIFANIISSTVEQLKEGSTGSAPVALSPHVL